MTSDVAGQVVVAEVGPAAAPEVTAVIHAAFGARPALDPPSTATEETVESVASALRSGGGLLASRDGRPVGALLLDPTPGPLVLRRVSVLPGQQHTGVAQALAGVADEVAVRRGHPTVQVTARSELPDTVRFWQRGGYREVARAGTELTLAKELPVVCEVPSADDMRTLAHRLSAVLRAGDVVLLTGDLGAGKTTFTQGLGAGLAVRGDITSPTFVISRVHPSLRGGPALVHVDAYRVGGVTELDDLDLDISVEDSVTVVEWGEGIAEALAEDRLDVRIVRATGNADGSASAEDGHERRTVLLTPVGARWVGSGLARAVA